MRLRRTALGGVVVAALTVAAPAWAHAETVAVWQMNEAEGSRVMVDSSGNRLNGTIGADVNVHEAARSGWGYRFFGDARIVNPRRLVTVPDDDRLDPGLRPYAVTIRFKTVARHPNIIQKGQANQTGGYWKLVIKDGWPRCHFRDGTGKILAIGFVDDPRPETQVSDGRWHTVRCERTITGVKVTLNYGRTSAISRFIPGIIGSVNNTRPLMIGGKLYCDGITVGCDYFRGVIDWVRIERPVISTSLDMGREPQATPGRSGNVKNRWRLGSPAVRL